MAILTAGNSTTLTLTDSDSVTINTAGVLTLTAVSGLGVAAGKLGEFSGSRTLGPFAAGQLTLAVSGADCYYEVADPADGSLASGVWTKVPTVFRLRLTGTGTCVVDSRNRLGVVSSAVASFSPAGATNQIEYPYAGDDAVEIRVTLTGTCKAEVL